MEFQIRKSVCKTSMLRSRRRVNVVAPPETGNLCITAQLDLLYGEEADELECGRSRGPAPRPLYLSRHQRLIFPAVARLVMKQYCRMAGIAAANALPALRKYVVICSFGSGATPILTAAYGGLNRWRELLPAALFPGPSSGLCATLRHNGNTPRRSDAEPR